MKYVLTLLLSIIIFTTSINSQSVGLGTTTPHSSAQVEIRNTNKGLLLPRVSLTSATDITTVPAPAISLIVYNTNNALADGTGYYYWSGSKWLKIITNTAGGDLSGNYPNPIISKLNGIPVLSVTPDYTDGGKIFRYNSFTKQYEFQQPIEFGETIAPGFIGLGGNGSTPPRFTRSGDDANMIPLCYGKFNAVNNMLTGQTANVSVSKVSTGIYRITITPGSIGNYNFNPAVCCILLDFGTITYYRESANTIVVDTWNLGGALEDHSFSFLVYNR